MTKEELITAISSEAGISKADANKALSAVFTEIGKALKNGERVSIPGFGTFNVVERKARKGRNPRTGAAIKIAAKKVVKFKAGSKLSNKV